MANTRTRGSKGRGQPQTNSKLLYETPGPMTNNTVKEFHSYAHVVNTNTPTKTSDATANVTKPSMAVSTKSVGVHVALNESTETISEVSHCAKIGAVSTEPPEEVATELTVVSTEPSEPRAKLVGGSGLSVGSGTLTVPAGVSTEHTQPSLGEILKEIKACREDMRVCRADLAKKIEENRKGINDLKHNSEFFFEELKDVQTKVTATETAVESHEARIQFLENKLNANESHSRRFNLRLYNLPEEEGENVKRKVMDICCNVAPDMADSLHFLIDVCHRIGSKEDKRTRPVIIRFLSLSARKHIWSKSKDAEIIKVRGMRFQEDFTTWDKEARMLVWPQIREARKKNLRAYYIGAKGYIEGKEIKLK